MNKYILIVPLLLICAFSAGCIMPTETADPILGTWVSGEYTNLAGTQYSKMVEQFKDDYTILEELHGTDGTIAYTKSIWMKKENGGYASYYAPITFNYNPARNTAVINCDFFNIDDITVYKKGSESGAVGLWINENPVEIIEDIYYLEFDVEEGGTGTVKYLKEDKEFNGSSIIHWTELGTNLFVITITDPVEWNIGSDGNLHDNYGVVYVKQV